MVDVSVIVRVPMMVDVSVAELMRAQWAGDVEGGQDHPDSHSEHEQARDQLEPERHFRGGEAPGQHKRAGREKENDDCMGDGHDQSQQEGVPYAPAGGDKVGTHDRLAVTGFERVERADPERGQ
jgi:hypothetical protein